MIESYQITFYSSEEYAKKFQSFSSFDNSFPIQIFTHQNKDRRDNKIHIINSNDPLINFYLIELSKSLFSIYSRGENNSQSSLESVIYETLDKCLLDSQNPENKLLKLSRIQLNLKKNFPLLYVQKFFNNYLERSKIKSLQSFSAQASEEGRKKVPSFGLSTPAYPINPNYKEILNS